MSVADEDVLTAAEMRAAEEAHDGPTLELMERAGRACAEAAVASFPAARRWTVNCGGGANGGDGFVVARHLVRQGRQVELLLHADPARLSGDTAANYTRCVELGLPIRAGETGGEAVVDAILGTGFHGELRPAALAAIETINGLGLPTVSVDVPSGVDASSGEVPACAVRADLTVTFHRRKVGHVVSPGALHAGRIVVADIGLPTGTGRRGEAGHSPVAMATVGPAILRELPIRGPGDNKYTAGSVLVVGGSRGLTGAPALSALASLRAGAGVAVMCVPASLSAVFEAQVLELMTRPCHDEDGAMTSEACAGIVEAARRADAVAIGPGLGRAQATSQLVRDLLAELSVPVVLDADGLWALNGQLETLRSRRAPTVLTPHAGELGRLLERPSAEIDAQRLLAARTAAEMAGAVVVLKGADTIVADGSSPTLRVLVSELGTPGLATAGSGDVLTGAIAAAIAKGVPPARAAALGAALCGLAARAAGARLGTPGLIASDIAHAIPSVVSDARATGRVAR